MAQEPQLKLVVVPPFLEPGWHSSQAQFVQGRKKLPGEAGGREW